MINKIDNYYIEASAGTGKTYNIIKMLEVFTKEISLDKILILTYTEKAVGELKARVRRSIKSDKNSEIYTFHAFCQRMLYEYAIASNQPMSLDVTSDVEFDNFLESYIRDTKIFNYIEKFYEYDINIDTLKRDLKTVVNLYYLDKDYKERKEIVSIDKSILNDVDLDFIIDMIDSNNLDEFISKNKRFKEIYDVLSDNNYPNLNKLLVNIKEEFDEKRVISFNGHKFNSRTINKFSDYEKEMLSKIKTYKDYFDKKTFNQIIVKLLILTYIDDLYISWQEEKKKRKLQSFNDMIAYVREEICSDGPLKQKIKDRYSLAIIDEFQDTNQKQWDIFKKIFLEDENHHIIVVGDPKQSIYSFQGADLHAYIDAINYLKDYGAKRELLDVNYRSTPQMIAGCNDLCKAKSFFGDTFIKSKAPQVNDQKSLMACFDGKEIEPIWVVYDEENKYCEPYSYSKTVANYLIDMCSYDEKGNTRLQLFYNEKVNDIIVKKKRNVSFKDICVLAKTRSEMFSIEKELRKNGIPCIRNKDESLFTDKECAHLIAIFEALVKDDFTQYNRKAFKKALFTCFFNKSIRELNLEKYERNDTVEMEIILEWQELARSKKWENLIDSIINDSKVLYTLSGPDNIQSLSKIKQLCRYSCEYLSNDHDLVDLIHHLKSFTNKSTNDDENCGIIEKGTDFDAVKIMTIHASKGLQFPIVISMGGEKGPIDSSYNLIHEDEKPVISSNKEKYLIENALEWKNIFYVDYTRAEYLLFIPFYRPLKEPFSFIANSTNELIESGSNNYRLVNVIKSSNKSSRTEDVKKILSINLEKEKNLEKENKIAETDIIDSKEEQDAILKTLIRDKFGKLIFKHSYTSLSHSNERSDFEDDIIVDDNKNVDKEGIEIKDAISMYDLNALFVESDFTNEECISLSKDFPKGNKIGTALHSIFERYDFDNIDDDALKEIIISSFNEEGIETKEEWIDDSKKIVREVLSSKLPIIHGANKVEGNIKLNLLPTKDYKAEMEFMFNNDLYSLRNYCNGFIDLVFKRGQYYSVLDWKSDILNDSDLLSYNNKDIKKHVDNCYSIQRVLYSYTLIKWLKNIYNNETEEEIFNNHFGGIYYVFLRGCNKDSGNGVYAQTWKSYNELQNAYQKIVKDKMY